MTVGDLTLEDGSISVTDADNASSLSITNNTITDAKGISVTMDALTTGDMLYLDNGGSSITGDGKFINCNNDDTSVFSVASGGLTTIAGDSSGTDALIITNGDILVSSGNIDMTVGDLTLEDGSISVTDADNASSLSITNNTITDTDALVDISSSSITTGAMMLSLIHI